MLRYDSAASDWHNALPLGNGRLGTMVYGGVHRETLRLNEESVWYGGPMNRTPLGAKKHLDDLRHLIRVGRHREAETLIEKRFLATPKSARHYEPLGTCTVDFNYSQEPWGAKSTRNGLEHYERTLNLERAESVVQYATNGVEMRREIIASYADNAICMQVVSDGLITFTVSLTRMSDIAAETNEFLDSIEVINQRIILHATPGGKDSNSLCLVAGVKIDGEGSLSVVGRELEVTAKKALVVLTARTKYTHEDVQHAAMSDMDVVFGRTQGELWERHLLQWHALYNRMDIQLFSDGTQLMTPERLKRNRDPGLISLYHAYGRYLLMSCSRSYPKALPANLQGIWNPTFQPPWGSKFTININLQMNYWCAHISNLSDCELPLFDLLKRMAVKGQRTASEVWGCRGWCAHHCTDIYADTETQDRWMPSTLWPLGGAWLCTHIWEHYSFTGDKEFLSSMLKTLAGCVDFILDFLITDITGKYLVTSPSLSPENTFLHNASGEKGVFCEGSTMDQEIVRQVFIHFLASISTLHDTSQNIRVSAVQSALSRLPPIAISPVTGTIQEWGMTDHDEVELGHRHISHLYALHPGSNITTLSDPKIVNAATKTLLRRLEHGGGHTGWSRAWLINLWARLRRPEQCQKNIDALLKHSTLPNMLDTHPPFQIDGNFGGAAGIVECLVQSHEEIRVEDRSDPIRLIRLLPSCPADWKKGKVRGVKCRGGFELDFEWDCGQIQEPVHVKSLLGNEALLIFHYAGSDASDAGIQARISTLSGLQKIRRNGSAG